MSGTGAFLMKDLVLFAASFYLLEQDLLRFQLGNQELTPVSTIGPRGWCRSTGRKSSGSISASSAVSKLSRLIVSLRCLQLRFWLRQIVPAVDSTQYDLTAAQQAI
jgi:hypothetical protein